MQFSKKIKKTVYLLNINNYSPRICELTYPLIKMWANKIGAETFVIEKRKFPKFPPVYEKLQIYELAQKHENDWNIYIDSDAVVHPDMPDVTTFLPKDTVLHNGMDFAPIRWKEDKYFLRDGRHLGSCNWFTVASDLCIDLWKPLDDLTLQEAVANISPTISELNATIVPGHLIDDYTLSRNIAKYGLKAITFIDLLAKYGNPGDFLYHEYLVNEEQKYRNICSGIYNRGLMPLYPMDRQEKIGLTVRMMEEEAKKKARLEKKK